MTSILTKVVTLIAKNLSSGCAAEELGVEVPSPKRIPDKYMTSSSDLSSSYQAFRGRIGLESRGPWGNAWCASESDSEPYIQIFFGMSFKAGYRTTIFFNSGFLNVLFVFLTTKCILVYM